MFRLRSISLRGKRGMTPKAENIKIRLLEFFDISEVAQIEKECFSTPWSGKAILESSSGDDGYFIVAEKNHNGRRRIAGYAGLYRAVSEAYIYNIAVRREYRKMGIGERLTKELISYCIKSHLEFISLEVRCSNNAAINLYKKLGFRTLGERKEFYKNPTENALIMTKYFK